MLKTEIDPKYQKSKIVEIKDTAITREENNGHEQIEIRKETNEAKLNSKHSIEEMVSKMSDLSIRKTEQEFPCSECDKIMKSASGLKRHLNKIHKIDLEADSKSFECPKCMKKFSKKQPIDTTCHPNKMCKCINQA